MYKVTNKSYHKGENDTSNKSDHKGETKSQCDKSITNKATNKTIEKKISQQTKVRGTRRTSLTNMNENTKQVWWRKPN